MKMFRQNMFFNFSRLSKKVLFIFIFIVTGWNFHKFMVEPSDTIPADRYFNVNNIVDSYTFQKSKKVSETNQNNVYKRKLYSFDKLRNSKEIKLDYSFLKNESQHLLPHFPSPKQPQIKSPKTFEGIIAEHFKTGNISINKDSNHEVDKLNEASQKSVPTKAQRTSGEKEKKIEKKPTHAFPRIKVPQAKKHLPAKGKSKGVYAVSHVIDQTEISLNQTEIEKIKNRISKLNAEQLIRNERIYGPLLRNNTIIVIQVHKRLANLKLLVSSLYKVRDIASALVIFSHDFYSEEMNNFVKNITEFRTMQIFFPFSIQLHPMSFPGRNTSDCQWNVKSESKESDDSCTNYHWPDLYGHFREPGFTQIKHHWWWKLHRVFNNLNATRNFSGEVLFLEEDHYVVEDLLHMLKMMRNYRNENDKDSKVILMGNYKRVIKSISSNKVQSTGWIVNKHNMGFSVNRNSFEILSSGSCSSAFCSFDDYNWDWSLNRVLNTCIKKEKFKALTLIQTRVFHMGNCGTHKRTNNCDLNPSKKNADNQIKLMDLFPKTLTILKASNSKVKTGKPNGGWGDLRDILMCNAISNGTMEEKALTRFYSLKRTSTLKKVEYL